MAIVSASLWKEIIINPGSPIQTLLEKLVSEEIIKIFYSYSRKDLDMRNTLGDHLAALIRANRIQTWHDLELEAGTEWESAILDKLDKADIILLLVSRNFIASEYCYGTELKRAIARHNEGTARVIPVILRPCDWNQPYVPFSKLNVLPTHAEPITSWADQDAAFTIVAQQIRETVDQLRAKKLAERQAQERQSQQLLALKETAALAERKRILQERQAEEEERLHQARELKQQQEAEATKRLRQRELQEITRQFATQSAPANQTAPPKTPKKRTILWIALILLALGHSTMGIMLAAASAPLWALALAGILVCLGAWATSRTLTGRGLVFVMAIFWSVAPGAATSLCPFLLLAVPLAIPSWILSNVIPLLSLLLFIPVGVAPFISYGELRESLSQFHIFCILASTSELGLGLGYWGVKSFYPTLV